VVFTKLKAELVTLAQPVPVPDGLFCDRSGPRRAGGLGQDSNFPCPRLPVPDDRPKAGCRDHGGQGGLLHEFPALPENLPTARRSLTSDGS
jgi:hypothetical protein